MPRTRGCVRHVESADAALNAIEKLTPVIGALRQLEAGLNAGANHPYLREFPHPVHLNVGTTRSGDWSSTVPPACAMECRLAYLPGVTVDQTQAHVREAVVGAPLIVKSSTAITDQRFFLNDLGIPATSYGPAPAAPGSS